MRYKKASKALPILTIVFFGVSLVLFLAKTVLMTALNVMGTRSLLSAALNQSLTTVIFAAPAVLLIVYAALVLKKSMRAKAILTAALGVQALSALYYVMRIVIGSGEWKHFGKEMIYVLCFALVALFSLIAFIFNIKGKKTGVLMILAAAAGMLVAGVLFLWNIMFMLDNSAFYAAHALNLVLRLTAYTSYAAAIVFHFVALIIAACVKLPAKGVAVKLKMQKASEN